MTHSLRAALLGVGLVEASGPPVATPQNTTVMPVPNDRPLSRDDALSGQRPAWLHEGTVGMSRHTVEQFRERFEPDLDFPQAKAALIQRLRTGIVTFSKERPRWLVSLSGNRNENKNLGYVEVDGEMVFPLRATRGLPDRKGRLPRQPFYLVTCLYSLSFGGDELIDAAHRRVSA
jgi:hypothetical protein